VQRTVTSIRYGMVGQDALVVMAIDGGYQPVQVTAEAMTAMSDDGSSFDRHLGVVAEIARKKIVYGQIAFDGRVWITGGDVRRWALSPSTLTN
jgi:hypothetical protein